MTRRRILHAAASLTALAALASCTAHTPSKQPPPPDLLTVAESSDFTRTATYDDVTRLLRNITARSDRVHLSSIGDTVEGRPIPLAVIADPPVTSPQQARDDPRTTILLFGNIHAGEVCGKEALLMIARDLALTDNHPLLDELIVCLVPIYNADGNEQFSPDNRPGQIGPDEMGIRQNAQGFDLNRDHIKAEAPETRALIRFMSQWDPAIIVDTHTTNGSLHRYTLTYQGPKHPAGDPEIIHYVRDRMLPEIDRSFENTTGYHTFFYGNFARDHTLWVTYPAEPRFGVAYRGLRNRLSIITEAYAYAAYRDRVLATRAFCDAILQYAARNTREIRALTRAADQRTIDAGRAGAPIHLRTETRPFPDPVTVLGYERDTETEGAATAPRDYTVSFYNLFIPSLSVPRPRAYALPASLSNVLEKLHDHAIRTQTFDHPITAASTETYTITGFTHAEKPFQGHRRISDIEITTRAAAATFPPGTVFVPTDQPLGSLAAYLLEPQASDGLAAWNLLDDHLAPGAAYPITRILDPLPAD